MLRAVFARRVLGRRTGVVLVSSWLRGVHHVVGDVVSPGMVSGLQQLEDSRLNKVKQWPWNHICVKGEGVKIYEKKAWTFKPVEWGTHTPGGKLALPCKHTMLVVLGGKIPGLEWGTHATRG
uniref:Uncharacterized protein n=1 Tax=Timema poppense TaxID=170557 RepID=A0A7R9GTL9_TIMPO|nr:unnamed protein product [Timema poppensis]